MGRSVFPLLPSDILNKEQRNRTSTEQVESAFLTFILPVY